MLLTQRKTWKRLAEHAKTWHYPVLHPEASLVKTKAISLDYGHQSLDSTAINLLIELAKECDIQDWVAKLMNGSAVNQESPALHTALRRFDVSPLWVGQVNIQQEIIAAQDQMRLISDKIRSGQWLGSAGEPITHIVNLGIGGSMLGPLFCIEALSDYSIDTLTYHFISDFDSPACDRVLRQLNPNKTLFIVSSKSFTTIETLSNAEKILEWGGYSSYSPQHFIAVTANVDRAKTLGFHTVLPIWSWVGGRFSVCSAINLMTCIAIGYEKFMDFLRGAACMDEHFQNTDVANNLPMMLALLGIWNNNILKMNNLLILTYAKSLERFVPYLQQLEMESNGKSTDKQGREVNYSTVPIIWGGSGNQAQHSYFQLLSQGTHRLSTDLISIESMDKQVVEQHKEALFWDKNIGANPNRYIPCNHLKLADNTPFTMGALIALYEHKIFVQSIIWNLNPFDQPGVEWMKKKMAQSTIRKTTVIT